MRSCDQEGSRTQKVLLVEGSPGAFDVVVDDGLHVDLAQKATMYNFWPCRARSSAVQSLGALFRGLRNRILLRIDGVHVRLYANAVPREDQRITGSG